MKGEKTMENPGKLNKKITFYRQVDAEDGERTGQKLIPGTLDKIARLRRMLDERGYENVEIEVDGNVSFENAAKMSRAGANIFVAGTSSIYAKTGSVRENAEKLRSVI